MMETAQKLECPDSLRDVVITTACGKSYGYYFALGDCQQWWIYPNEYPTIDPQTECNPHEAEEIDAAEILAWEEIA